MVFSKPIVMFEKGFPFDVSRSKSELNVNRLKVKSRKGVSYQIAHEKTLTISWILVNRVWFTSGRPDPQKHPSPQPTYAAHPNAPHR